MAPYSIDLTSYDSVRTNSVLIYRALHSRWMPLGSTPEQQWPDTALEVLRAWVNQGWRRSASDPLNLAERIAPPSERPLPVRVRRDLRSLTQAELDDYRIRVDDAFKVSDSTPDAPGQQFFGIHGDWCLHYQEGFLFWHRAYLLHFERLIGCAAPYWNWFAKDASVDGSPSAGLPAAFTEVFFVHPRTGETRPNPLRFAAARNGASKACVKGPQPGMDCHYVQRDPLLYTCGDDQRTQRARKIGLTLLYQQQVRRAMAFPDFSVPQGVGHPWANIPSFDPPPPDSDYVYRDVNFDGAYEQPHDNYHGWVGPDMADNSYTAFDPIFFSYHANIDRIFELWLRMHADVRFTANFPLRPFAGPLAQMIVFDDPRGFSYTTIGDIAKDSRGLGYDFAPPVDRDFAGPYSSNARAAASRTQGATAHPVRTAGGTHPAVANPTTETLESDELLIRFENVRCTLDSFAIDAFLDLDHPTGADVDPTNPHYVGRLTRLGMGVADDRRRCIQSGVARILDATLAARRLGLAPGSACRLTLLVTRLPHGDTVTEAEATNLPGFSASLDWYRFGRPCSPRPSQAAPPSCCNQTPEPHNSLQIKEKLP
jgi:tyrosinase